MNPLPNRPLLNNAAMPLSLPNVPSFDQMPYNGRPRKILPEGNNILNGINLMSGPSSAPAGAQMNTLERGNPLAAAIHGQHVPVPSIPQSNQSHHSGPSQSTTPSSDISQGREKDGETEPRQLTAIFRPDADWKERLARQSQEAALSHENHVEEELKEEDGDMEDEETAVEEGGGKLWKTKRTLRK